MHPTSHTHRSYLLHYTSVQRRRWGQWPCSPLRGDARGEVSLQALLTGVAGVVVVQVLCLIVAGWQNRFSLTPDSVVYIRIAEYYATGQTHLAVAGYFGPLLSWLMVPWLGFVKEPIDAARIAMILSAILFLLGSVSVLRTLRLPRVGVVCGAWLVAAASITWSVENISPDLLLGGLLCLAVGRMVSPPWLNTLSTPFIAGLLCGAAYLAKAVAFPVTFLLSLGLGALWVISRRGGITQVVRSVGITLLGFALLAGPWVLILSCKYKQPTFSISGKIAHALVGPVKIPLEHPHFRTFDPPEPGRVTSWENPNPQMYMYWSPFGSLAYAQYQFRIICDNYRLVLSKLQGFDALGIGLLALVAGLLLHRPWRENLSTEPWRWAGVPVACLCLMYLPVTANTWRYYFPTYPFLIAASMGMLGWLTSKDLTRRRVFGLLGLGLVVGSFAMPVLLSFPSTFRGRPNHGVYAYALAQKLQAAGLSGPLAAVANVRSLYIAFFMQQPWYGSEENPTPARLKASRASLVAVLRHSPLLATLDQEAGFEDLDRVLFTSEDEARPFPWKLYRVTAP